MLFRSHDSGLRLVRSAKKILVSEEEWAALHSGQVRYARRPWHGIPLTRMPLSDNPAAPFGKSWDVWGDGSITVILTPGHTKGSVTIRISGENGFILIVGDTGYNQNSWEYQQLPGPVYDKETMKKSLAWVQEMHRDPNCIAVLASHDPEEKRTEIKITEDLKNDN